jgi:photosystem II stability/assembly factor-like uncharacterized protein
MKKYLLITALFAIHNCFAQWTTLNIPDGGRYDDVFFAGDGLNGWAAGGNSGKIYHTKDGGETWTMQDSTGKYLRSIEFISPSTGFCGSLDSSFYKTTDGGKTWTDIAASINPKPPGICGLSAPGSNVIYGCGIWSAPAYVIKSVDGGKTWKSINMSAYAVELVDIHFTSADTGFVTGKANPANDGGVILYTTNGGNTWSVLYKTKVLDEIIWKLQTPDRVNFYGSVSPSPATHGVRMLHSNNRGMNWDTVHVSDTDSYIQTVGFITPQKGWIGGQVLFETEDAGLTWKKVQLGSAYNRFFKLNNQTAFLSGNKIYRYGPGIPSGLDDKQPYDEIHKIVVSPNPASNTIEVTITTANKTYAQVKLYSAKGELLDLIHDRPLTKGEHHFSVQVSDYAPQVLTLVLHTNEGVLTKKVVKK